MDDIHRPRTPTVRLPAVPAPSRAGSLCAWLLLRALPSLSVTPRDHLAALRARPWPLVAPSLVTALGLLLGLTGALLLPTPAGALLLAASLALDVADGYVARRLDASSALGARCDHAVDTAVAYAVAWHAWSSRAALGVVVALVVVATIAPGFGLPRRVLSGRTLVTAAALVRVVWGAL